MLLSLILLSAIAQADDGTGGACTHAYKKAQVTCAAHEHALTAEALSIVSEETRSRVIKSEQAKLEAMLSNCKKMQMACALRCDEALESATLDGENVTGALESLSDCRQGSIARHMEAMNKKRAQLSKMQSLKAQKSRTFTRLGMK